MKFKDAICCGVAYAIGIGGVALCGAWAALCGQRIGREDGKAIAYADCSNQLKDLIDKHETNESEKGES